MAQLALGVVGAAVGFVISGFNPAGAYWGWTVGVLAGALLFPPEMPTQVGPQLGDRSVQTSTYGAPIPVAYGTIRTAGNVIWATDIVEKTHVEKSGGKGAPSVSTVSYTYYGNLAVGICEGEADLIRIWANGKLIYDASGLTPSNVETDGLVFTWYRGDETQLPSAYIESFEGVGQVPGYRGLCYIVFEELPLANYGNGIPQLTFEVTGNVADNAFSDTIGTFADYRGERSYPIWDRAIQVNAKPASSGNTVGIHELQFWDIEAMTTVEVLAQDMTDIVLAETLSAPTLRIDVGLLPSGNLVYEVDEDGTSDWWFIEINPDTMYEIKSKRSLSTGAHVPRGARNHNSVGFRVGGKEFIFWNTWIGNGRTYRSGTGHVGPTDSSPAPGQNAQFIPQPGFSRSQGGFFELNRPDTTTLRVRKWTLTADEITAGTYVYDVETVIEIDLATVDPTWSTFSGVSSHRFMLDRVDGTIIIGAMESVTGSTDELRFLKVDPDLGTILWISDILPNNHLHNNNSLGTYSLLENGRLVYLSTAENAYLIDTATGDFELVNSGYTPETADDLQAYNSQWNVVIDNYNEIFYIGRKTGLPTTVKAVVDDVSSRADLGAADIDTTDLAAMTLPGYMLSRNMEAKAAIAPLANLYLFDAAEIDDKLVFVARGAAAAGTLNEQDLVEDKQRGGSITETRAAETELPAETSVTYMDPNNDYNQMTHRAKRILAPSAEVQSSNKLDLQVAAALDPDFVKEQTMQLLISSWNERIRRDMVASRDFIKHVPTDVITLTMDDGRVVRTRIMTAALGSDLTYRLSLVEEDSSQFSAPATADPGQGVPGQTVPTVPNLKLILCRSPLLRDSHDNGRVSSQYYAFMGVQGLGSLSLGLLYESPDGVAYDQIGTATTEPTWGYATDDLGDVAFDAKWQIDKVNTVNVTLKNEGTTLSSITQDQLFVGENNACALIHGNGDVEIFKFQDVVAEADGTFTLSNLLRGRRGTDPFTVNHGSGDIFLLLEDVGIIAPTALADVDVEKFLKAVPGGSFLESVFEQVEANPGNDLKPWAGVWVESDGSLWGSNIVISWKRRTRINGGLIGGTAVVPLNEDSEEYEAEIWDGATLKRTYTSLSTPTFTWTTAEQTTDFPGGDPGSISVIVYQVSAQVGRGFPSYKTVILTA